ncbi:carbohydrate ABC transporter membrane protein 2 (CUT1 family) [Hydrogenispora ethanolica]|uniref:Carbohydrate ABC transporter membrane protein 2 (CUT1 family) n=1 Tax=Hydrogenispora ethanolica TaxID=1082276 RepID=A0A4R1S878_HYDET|nr:carbohydrate ABC transporter permease [Hydrogenispora ethanolica]TCL75080.1 carbohydrate ABC transporter membrane protein 2 (CUT1 family) [Hydrogenispora ethanolica]
MQAKHRGSSIISYALLSLIILAMLFPFAVMLSTSLKTYQATFQWPPQWLSHPVMWQNYFEVWVSEYHFSKPFVNSFVVSFFTSLLSILFGFPAAYALTRFRFRGHRALMFVVLLTQMFSPLIIIIGMMQMMSSLGLINSLMGLILSNGAISLPMAIWLLHGYLKGIPLDMEHAAMIDGCSRVVAVRKIIFPIALPAVLMAGIYAFIMAWNNLLFPLAFITDQSLKTIPLALTDFVGMNIVYWHQMMAGGIIATVPIAILFSFVQKFFVAGIMGGAIKE